MKNQNRTKKSLTQLSNYWETTIFAKNADFLQKKGWNQQNLEGLVTKKNIF